MNRAQFNGTLKAYASDTNPLQTIVDLVITPFSVNSNGQAIPRSEAQNIITTALYQPLKINFSNAQIHGHKDAIPIGPIIFAEETENAIIGRAIIWNDEFPHVTEYLLTNDQLPGTSWEVYYKQSEVAEGAEWLYGCIYAANTIVENPAYGNETLLRAIAEDMNPKQKAETMDQERETILALQEQISTMWYALDDLYFKTYEIEASEATQTDSVDSFVTRFNELVSTLNQRANDAGIALSELKANYEQASEELTALRQEKAELARQKELSERKARLAEHSISIDDTELSAMSEDRFAGLLAGLSLKPATSEVKNIKIPEPITTREIQTRDLVESHKALRGKS